jgi:hypothetical protein
MEQGGTYAGSADKIHNRASDIFFTTWPFGRHSIKKRAEHISFFAYRVHSARDN